MATNEFPKCQQQSVKVKYSCIQQQRSYTNSEVSHHIKKNTLQKYMLSALESAAKPTFKSDAAEAIQKLCVTIF
jgi:hypothetical protein